MQKHERQVPIWFFVGSLLATYGLLILAAGIYGWLHPPPPEQRVKLWNYHADVWWGAVLALFGMLYVVKFWPSRSESLTGKLSEPELANRDTSP